jgi:hypothetical protein
LSKLAKLKEKGIFIRGRNFRHQIRKVEMETKKAQIKYNDLMDMLKHHSGDIILGELKDWEITVVDENGKTVGKFVLGNGN